MPQPDESKNKNALKKWIYPSLGLLGLGLVSTIFGLTFYSAHNQPVRDHEIRKALENLTAAQEVYFNKAGRYTANLQFLEEANTGFTRQVDILYGPLMVLDEGRNIVMAAINARYPERLYYYDSRSPDEINSLELDGRPPDWELLKRPPAY